MSTLPTEVPSPRSHPKHPVAKPQVQLAALPASDLAEQLCWATVHHGSLVTSPIKTEITLEREDKEWLMGPLHSILVSKWEKLSLVRGTRTHTGGRLKRGCFSFHSTLGLLWICHLYLYSVRT